MLLAGRFLWLALLPILPIWVAAETSSTSTSGTTLSLLASPKPSASGTKTVEQGREKPFTACEVVEKQDALTPTAALLTSATLISSGIQPYGVPAQDILASTEASYQNPTLDQDSPDPSVIFDNGTYWMMHTSGRVPGWPLWKSTDLVHWTFDRHLLDANKPDWMHDRFWAPEIHKVGSTYVLTFTAGDTTGQLCIGIATAAEVSGPYRVQPAPLLRVDDVGVIDSHLFQDTNGKKYLLWKDDQNAKWKPNVAREPCHIFIREMNSTCTTFAPGSTPSILLTSEVDSWEAGIVEAPWMIKRGSMYYLFYSGNAFENSYAEGVARSDRPTGGFVRALHNPILRSNDTWIHPGHGAIIQDAKGTDWHLYHAYHREDPRRGRVQLLDQVNWQHEPGWPAFRNNGTPSTTRQSTPVITTSHIALSSERITIVSRKAGFGKPQTGFNSNRDTRSKPAINMVE